jgi:hypothetical protein
MAKNRLKTLTELRRVKVDSQIVLTYRCGKYGFSISIKFFLFQHISHPNCVFFVQMG